MSIKHIPLEKTIEKNIIQYLNKEASKEFNKKIKAVKWSQNGRQRGNPDIICCIDGQLFLFEVKRPKIGKLTDLQLETLTNWSMCGAFAEVVTNIEDVREYLKLHIVK